jgi:hypothetical protein
VGVIQASFGRFNIDVVLTTAGEVMLSHYILKFVYVFEMKLFFFSLILLAWVVALVCSVDSRLVWRTLNLICDFIVDDFLLLHLQLFNILTCTRVFLLLLFSEYLLWNQHLDIFLSVKNEHVEILVEYLDTLPILMQISDVVLDHVVWSKDAILTQVFPWVIELSIALTMAESLSRIGSIEPLAASLLTVLAIIVEIVFVPLLLRILATWKLNHLLRGIDFIDFVLVLCQLIEHAQLGSTIELLQWVL